MKFILERTALLLLVLSLTGCVATNVTSTRMTEAPVVVESILLHVQEGRFGESTTAGKLGQQNLNDLNRSLIARLPSVFQASGTPMRVLERLPTGPQDRVRVAANEYLMVITPQSATYSTRSGQSLAVDARLLDPRTLKLVWRADIRMATPGFGKFDDELAAGIGGQLIEKLRNDGILPTK